jgi:hypothetical protein
MGSGPCVLLAPPCKWACWALTGQLSIPFQIENVDDPIADCAPVEVDILGHRDVGVAGNIRDLAGGEAHFVQLGERVLLEAVGGHTFVLRASSSDCRRDGSRRVRPVPEVPERRWEEQSVVAVWLRLVELDALADHLRDVWRQRDRPLTSLCLGEFLNDGSDAPLTDDCRVDPIRRCR